ncbi:MAG: efflux RND transporter permease subunit [Candidatus Geothermincolia bacterium]
MVAKVFNWLGRLSEQRPWWVIGVIVLISAVAVFGLTRIKQDFGYEAMLPQNSESVKTLKEANKVFGGTAEEQVLVVSARPLDPAAIRQIAGYSKALQDHRDLWPAFANDVTTPLDNMVYYPTGALPDSGAVATAGATSAGAGAGSTPTATAESLSAKAGSLTDQQLIDQVKLNLEAAAQQAKALGFAAPTNVSADQKALLINVKLNPSMSQNKQIKKVTAFEEATKDYFDKVGGATTYVAGAASMNKDSSQRTMKDTSVLFLLAFVFIVIVLFITFRKVSDVLLTLLVILVTVLWVEGMGGFLKFPFSYTSAAIIPLLLGIDIAYAIHVMSRYYEERRSGLDPHQSALNSVVTVGVAVFLTAATTAFGFASFGISNMPPIQQFGALCVAGVMFSFVLAVTLLPAVVVLRDRRAKAQEKWDSKKAERDEKGEGWLDKFLVKIAILSEHHKAIVMTITVVILAACVVLSFKVTTEADMQKMMPKDMPFMKAQTQINKYFGGQDIAYTLVKGDVLAPASLNAMLAYEDGLTDSRELASNGTQLFARDKIFSLADLVKKVSGAIPATKGDVLKVLMGMSTGKKSESQNTLINPKYPDVTMVSIRVDRGTQEDMKKIAETLKAQGTKVVAGNKGLQMSSSGMPVLMNDMMGSLVPTQLKTSVLALILCALIVTMVFGSIFFGLAATSVVFIGIALEIGALALLNWPLDFMTVMVSSLVIGAGIDFGIHVTHRFREEWHLGGVSVDEAMRRTIGNVGKALVAAAVTTAGAFAIIATSQISYLRRFGGITALSLTFALLASLLVLPSILAWRAERVEKVKARQAEKVEAGETA